VLNYKYHCMITLGFKGLTCYHAAFAGGNNHHLAH